MVEERRKTFVGFVFMCVLIVGLLAYMVLSSTGKDGDMEECISASQEIPAGFAQEMPDRKSESYQVKGNITTEEYFDMLSCDDVDDDGPVSDDAMPEALAGAGNSGAVERLFGPEVPGARCPEADCDVFPDRERPAAYLTQDERLSYDRKRVEMVMDVLSGSETASGGCAAGESGAGCVSEGMKGPGNGSREMTFGRTDDGIISSLDTPGGHSGEGACPVIDCISRCMFVSNGKVRDQDRVRIRLLDDYVADGVVIPANTHLTAVCRIGERLELSVRSVQLNGVIVPLSLEAYDMDGMPGIYCPETVSSRNADRASKDAISAAGSVIGGFVGSLANTIVRTGANLARNAAGKTSVSVVSGYEFFLVKMDKR